MSTHGESGLPDMNELMYGNSFLDYLKELDVRAAERKIEFEEMTRRAEAYDRDHPQNPAYFAPFDLQIPMAMPVFDQGEPVLRNATQRRRHETVLTQNIPAPEDDNSIEASTHVSLRNVLAVGVLSTGLLAGMAMGANRNAHREENARARAEASSQEDVLQPKLTSANFTYRVQEPVHMRDVALDIGVKQADLIQSNPSITKGTTLDAGAIVSGKVSATEVPVTRPVHISEVANQYGMSVDAVQSVNYVTEEGFIEDKVIVPGRMLLASPAGQKLDYGVISENLALSDTGQRELIRVNKNPLQGKASDALPDVVAVPVLSLDDPESVEVKHLVQAAAVPLPVKPLSPEQAPADQQVAVLPSAPKSKDSEEDSDTTLPPPTQSTEPEMAVAAPVVEAAVSELAPVEGAPVEATVSAPVVDAPAPAVPEIASVAEAAPEVPPTRVVEREATPEEKFHVELEEVKKAIDHGLLTGDAGPLNHMVVYSPIFKAYGLSEEFQTQGVRALPPANLLESLGIRYEFSHGTPDSQRNANSQVIVTILLTAAAMQEVIADDPVLAAQYPEACLRVGDLSALEGHKTHTGDSVDLTSVMQCRIEAGNSTADGPIFWINKDSSSINSKIQNPNHSANLDKALLLFLNELTIDGKPIVREVLYNQNFGDFLKNLRPNFIRKVTNHSNHIHAVTEGVRSPELKKASSEAGGKRPETNLDELRSNIFFTYAAGGGVEGFGKNRVISYEVTEAEYQAKVAVVEAAAPVAEVSAPSVSDEAAMSAQEHQFLVGVLRNKLPESQNIPSVARDNLRASEHFSAVDLAAQMYTESKFDPNARSQADARGLAQFMPGTWKEYGPEGVGPYDPAASAEAQRVYMDVLYKQVTKLIEQDRIRGDARELTFAAYNAGIGNVRKYGGVPPFKETKDYIERINTQSKIYGDAVQREYIMAVANSQVQQ